MLKSVNNNFIEKNIFPVRIITYRGNITNKESLLKEKELQITTSENDYVTLKNVPLSKNASVLVDFGKEMHAKIRILVYTCDGESPCRLRITYGESVSEAMSKIGFKGACNDHSTRDAEYFFPEFSDISLNYSGFRFANIELLSKNTTVRIKAITAVSTYRDIAYLGTFRCSNETINNIYDVCAYTCHLNMQQYIWDGIKRDRLVWVGDMHPEMLTVRTVFGTNDIIEKSLNFMRNTTPLPQWMNGMPTYSLWWLHILYDWYFYSGSTDFLNENKEYATELIKIISALVNDDGSDNLPSYFLDWPCNNKPQGISGSRALLALALKSSEELCKLFGEEELRITVSEKYKILTSTEINTYGAKQVTAILGFSGWLDKKQCGKEILENGCHGFSTFMSYYILKISAAFNIAKTLDALEDYYGTMLRMGATSFWEDFDIDWAENASPIDTIPEPGKTDIHADFGAFCYKGLRHSLCHGWSSAPTAFLIEEILGIRIEEPGCKTVSIKPNLGNLDFAEGSFPTPYGLITVKCKKTANGTYTEYNAPSEVTIIR